MDLSYNVTNWGYAWDVGLNTNSWHLSLAEVHFQSSLAIIGYKDNFGYIEPKSSILKEMYLVIKIKSRMIKQRKYNIQKNMII